MSTNNTCNFYVFNIYWDREDIKLNQNVNFYIEICTTDCGWEQSLLSFSFQVYDGVAYNIYVNYAIFFYDGNLIPLRDDIKDVD